eukprot:Rhum_TRINITY_DN16991_c0_g1::Rhum_TRINITY_DN16991_c0_g1_i1::g.164981::m.164981
MGNCLTPAKPPASAKKASTNRNLLSGGGKGEAPSAALQRRLLNAMRSHNLEEARVLLRGHKELGQTTFGESRDTAAHVAVRDYSGEEMINVVGLVGHGKMNQADAEGNTPLHLAAMTGQHKIVEILAKDYHINVDQPGGARQNTALHYAAVNGHAAVVQTLLDLGANVNVVNMDGDTALHLASSQGYGDVSQILGSVGGDLLAKNDNGETPLVLASQSNAKMGRPPPVVTVSV